MAHARSFRPSRRLEVDEVGLTMEVRLVHGASRIAHDAAPADGPPALRAEQVRVFADFATYLTDVATRPPAERRPPFCRIILPPRTGKTAVAGRIIDRSGLTATFIVPIHALLDQTVRELALWAPGVPIGSYSGERQSVVDQGVNVVTYAMLQTTLRRCPRSSVDRRWCSSTRRTTRRRHRAARSLAGAFDPLACTSRSPRRPTTTASAGWRATSPTSSTRSLPRRKRRMRIHYFGLFGAPQTIVPELADMMLLSRSRVDQLVRRTIAKLQHWRAIAAASEASLAGPEAGVMTDAARRRAAATAAVAAERARHLDDLLARQDALWKQAEKELLRHTASGYEWALTVLRDLEEAADRHRARSAFEARIARLHSRTPSAIQFRRRWSVR